MTGAAKAAFAALLALTTVLVAYVSCVPATSARTVIVFAPTLAAADPVAEPGRAA